MDLHQVVPPGTIVYGADLEPIGTVQSSESSYMTVDSDDFPLTYYIPVSAVVETREDGAYLSVTAEGARNQGWDRQPAVDSFDDQVTDLGSDYSAVQAEDSLDPEYDTMPVSEEAAGRPPRLAGATDSIERPSGETGPNTDAGA